MGRSYASDFALQNTPIFILGSSIMIPHTILYFVWFNSFSCNCFNRLCTRFLTKCAHQIVRKVFGKAFKPGSNDSEEDPKSVFYGYKATNKVVYVFALIVLEMFLVLAMIFWDKFLFKVSYGCPYNVHVRNLICYNSTSHNPINCSISEELLDDQSIECYRLIFDWKSAAGTAGGLYVWLSLGITFIPRMMLEITTRMSRKRAIWVNSFMFAFIILIQGVVFAVYLIFFWKNSWGELLSGYEIILIFQMVQLIPLSEFKKIDEVNIKGQDPNVDTYGANESTSLVRQRQT